MSAQPTLFDVPPPTKRLTLQDRFDDWIKDNPHILRLFLQYANEAREAGAQHYGIKAIAERVRWHVRIQSRNDEFKINNNWSSRLARLLVERDPRLKDFFEFRKLKA